ncbi:hypothetical protein PHLCEN_2v8680 [Hermanssonia centrifuga]|uniref:Uncharacterized protein n=1 Tax=Hermanssonia centrifuga TaxID=98765 RepID=A0A2R6NSX6_9APHY|nr:hypothetical protein PHLCEN_2v8680 [Hermanssonia centrifuga]
MSPKLDVVHHRVIAEGSSKRQRGVMKHRRVVRGFRVRLRGGEREGVVHISQEEGRDDSEAPGGAEAEEEIEEPR